MSSPQSECILLSTSPPMESAQAAHSMKVDNLSVLILPRPASKGRVGLVSAA